MSPLPMPALQIERSLTTAEVATRDRVTVETVLERVKRGEYPGARKEGRSYRFPATCRWTKPEVVDELAARAAAKAALDELAAWRVA